MSDLRRLRDDGDAFELELLASARGDRIPPSARGAVLAGIASSVAVSLASAPAAVASTSSAKAGVVANAAKWIASSVVGSALVVAAALPILQSHREVRVVPSIPAPTAAISVETSTLAPGVPSALMPSPPPVESSEAKIPARRSRPAPMVVAEPTPAGSSSASTADESTGASSLAAELRLIERARASLRAGRADDTLGALDEHRARFARGVLSEEAAVLRIEAYARMGDAATASSLATAFLAARPRSPYAPRVRRASIAREGAGPP